jgi:branched-chain amino acid transport system substrate-binding protein
MNFKMKALAAAAALALSAGAQAQISGNVVKIGVLNDQSGLYSDITGPGSTSAAKMAVEDFKAQNKGFTTPIEVVSADHQNKPDVGSQIASKWYDAEGVDMIVDVPTSSVALAVSQITKDKNKVHVNSGAATSDLTGKACSPNTVHWTYDTWMLANGTGGAIVKTGGDSWFFLTADYAFGHALERDTEAVVVKNGGKVLGKVRTPFPGTGLLVLPSPGAGFQGEDHRPCERRRRHDQLDQAGSRVRHREGRPEPRRASWSSSPTSTRSGLDKAQGLIFTETFYWDTNDQTRAFAKRFAAANGGKYPSMVQAGVYAGTLHYLKAVAALKSDDGAKVVAKMKELPTDDPLFGKGTIRADGRKLHPAYLVEVKKPSESKGPYDYYKIRTDDPGRPGVPPDRPGRLPDGAKK